MALTGFGGVLRCVTVVDARRDDVLGMMRRKKKKVFFPIFRTWIFSTKDTSMPEFLEINILI